MLIPMILLASLASPTMQDPAAPQEAPAVQSAGSADEHIQAGLAEFKRRRFAAAQDHFQKAVNAEPNSAAANFYLAYTLYKIAEPKRPFHPEKQRAAAMFAHAYELDPTFTPVWAKRPAKK